MQIFYKIIYNSQVNFVLRNLNKILPISLKIPPSGKLKFKTESGHFYLLTNQTNFITKELFYKGYQNFEYGGLFELIINQFNVFIDVGAHIGYYSFLAANINSSIKCYAFEPGNATHFYLKKNIGLNQLKNIKINKLALSNKKGSVTFNEVFNKKYSYLKHNLSGVGNILDIGEHENFNSYTVNTNKLDNLNLPIDISQNVLIKIDVEGAENLVLQGAKEFINSIRPVIICEILPFSNEIEIEELFSNIEAYKIFAFYKEGLIALDKISRKQDNGYRDFFFIPNEKMDIFSSFLK